MAKLIIPQLPEFETTLPSTGKKVTYRPITVKEESFLLMAKESDNPEDIFTSIQQVIKACVKTNFSKLSVLDVEWLFLQIRIRSVSNEVELGYRCTKVNEETGKTCNAKFDSVIDLNKVEIKGERNLSATLEFMSGTYKINLTQPNIHSAKEEDEVRIVFNMLDTIEQPDGSVLTKDDISFEEFQEFVETFTDKQLDKIRDCLGNIGSLYYKDVLRCPVCGTVNEVEYKSLEDFFS